MAPNVDDDLMFDGSNWEDLARLVTRINLDVLCNRSDYTDDDNVVIENAKVGRLGSYFSGAALDWLGAQYEHHPAVLQSFNGFVSAVKNHFAIHDEILTAHYRTQLDTLTWSSDLPVFFAEFDRLTAALGITGDTAKISTLRAKLPHKVLTLLAEQSLNFANYDTMRERLLVMWALDPGSRVLGVKGGGDPVTAASSPRRPKRRNKRGSKN